MMKNIIKWTHYHLMIMRKKEGLLVIPTKNVYSAGIIYIL